MKLQKLSGVPAEKRVASFNAYMLRNVGWAKKRSDVPIGYLRAYARVRGHTRFARFAHATFLTPIAKGSAGTAEKLS